MRTYFLVHILAASPCLVAVVDGIRASGQSNAAGRKRREVIHVAAYGSQTQEAKLIELEQSLSPNEEAKGIARFLQSQFSLTLNPSIPPTSSPILATHTTFLPSQSIPNNPEPQTPSPEKSTPYPTFPGESASPATEPMSRPVTYVPTIYPTMLPLGTPAPATPAPSRFGKTADPTSNRETDPPSLIAMSVFPTAEPSLQRQSQTPTLSPVSLVAPSLSPISDTQVPTGRPTTNPVIFCPSIPNDGCSICGENKCITEPDAIFEFPGQPVVRCDDLQDAGRLGLVPLDQCNFLPDLVSDFCGCTLGLAPAPVPMPAPAFNDTCPSIPDDGCSVCGQNQCITRPDSFFEFPGQPSVRCGDLQDAGQLGLVPLNQCNFLPALIIEACGCTPGVSPTPAPTPSPAPTFDGICPSIPEGGCSVCGDNKCITQPDSVFEFPGQPSVRCHDLQDAGELSLVPLEQCNFLPALIVDVCGCTSGLSPTIVPVPIPAPTVDGMCPSIPDGGCSVCGDDKCITVPSAIFSFPGQPSVQCSDLQNAGETGQVPLEQCTFLAALIIDACGCSPTATPKSAKGTAASPTLPLNPSTPTPDSGNVIQSAASEVWFETRLGLDPVQSKALVWLTSSTNFTSFSDTKKTQRYALACIFFSTYAVPSKYTDYYLRSNPNGWHKADSWVSDKEECDWYGILCDSNGDVEAIILKGNGLSGSFPSQVALLSSSLIRLDLTDNWIHNPGDEFNSFLGQLSNLQYLFIGSTFFEHDKGVPTELGLLSKLIAFDASNTRYTGKLNGDAFANKPILKSVNLSGNHFEVGRIPEELVKAPKLQHLYMEASNLTGDLSFLEHMKAIVDLWIGNNEGLSGSIPATIFQAKTLETLSITHCSLTGQLPSEMGSLESLKEVWLYDNHINGTIPDEFGGLFSLKTLELEFNSITGTIPRGVCNLTTSGALVVFEADCVNEVVCDCCTACFGKQLNANARSSVTPAPLLASMPPSGYPTSEPPSQLPSLSPSLSPAAILIHSMAIHRGLEFVSSNSYQSRALAWVLSHDDLDSFSDTKIVQRYTLACIYYSTHAVKTLYTEESAGADAPGWTTSDGWMDTHVDECHWHGLDCDSNDSVDSIELPSNGLTGHFAPEVQLLKESLIRLDIFDNHVYNPGHAFNAFLGELTNIQYLYYGFTNFEYEEGIPTEISKLTHLIEYDCAYTLYHGAIPREAFANMTELKRLTMGGNAYNSSVPTEIAQLKSLEYLAIDNADLTGDLSFIADLESIKELWLDTNPTLMGSLPLSIGDLSTLQSFSVANCGLTGEIPTQLGNLAHMQQLWLYGNELTGHIPTEMGNLNRMRIMELEENLITGTMPTEVCFNRPPIGSLTVLEADCENVTCSCCSSCV